MGQCFALKKSIDIQCLEIPSIFLDQHQRITYANKKMLQFLGFDNITNMYVDEYMESDIDWTNIHHSNRPKVRFTCVDNTVVLCSIQIDQTKHGFFLFVVREISVIKNKKMKYIELLLRNLHMELSQPLQSISSGLESIIKEHNQERCINLLTESRRMIQTCETFVEFQAVLMQRHTYTRSNTDIRKCVDMTQNPDALDICMIKSQKIRFSCDSVFDRYFVCVDKYMLSKAMLFLTGHVSKTSPSNSSIEVHLHCPRSSNNFAREIHIRVCALIDHKHHRSGIFWQTLENSANKYEMNMAIVENIIFYGHNGKIQKLRETSMFGRRMIGVEISFLSRLTKKTRA